MIRKVSSIPNINTEINSIPKKIDALFIGAHGRSDAFSLSGENWVEGHNVENINLDIISETGVVILQSCSTGQKGGIAERMAKVLKRTVLAPTVRCRPSLFNHDADIISESKWICPSKQLTLLSLFSPENPRLIYIFII